jgi:hypothetical protein
MNRLSTLIFFTILLQTFLSAQKYYPFETSNAVWNELKESGYLKESGHDYPPNKFIETYFINGDTIINDFKFYKIFIQGSNDSSYVGCFREEDRKVYYNGVDYFHFETDSIILLYDFNKQKNDTIYTGTWHRAVINEIDSILIGNSYRKRFQMDDGQFWIEGIGSNFGFLYPMTEIPTMYWRSELICYKHNDSLLYLSPNYIDCNTEKQPSTEFAPIGAKWYYSNRENPLGGPEEGYLLIESTGDTIIDYITVRKLKKTYFSSDGNKEELGFEFVYTIENKVYYLNEANSYLLYDFNAETGDTLTFREPYFTGFSSDSTFSLVVDSTNHLIINGINLKTIYLHNLSNILGRWDLYNVHIEKIGNTTYMFPQSSLDCDAACFDPLRCYMDDKIYYKLLWFPYNCDVLITSAENINSSGNYRIYPNPANNCIFLESPNYLGGSLTVKIYNLTGRCVLTIVDNSNLSTKTIDVSLIPQGLYIIEINDSWRDKVVIQY